MRCELTTCVLGRSNQWINPGTSEAKMLYSKYGYTRIAFSVVVLCGFCTHTKTANSQNDVYLHKYSAIFCLNWLFESERAPFDRYIYDDRRRLKATAVPPRSPIETMTTPSRANGDTTTTHKTIDAFFAFDRFVYTNPHHTTTPHPRNTHEPPAPRYRKDIIIMIMNVNKTPYRVSGVFCCVFECVYYANSQQHRRGFWNI